MTPNEVIEQFEGAFVGVSRKLSGVAEIDGVSVDQLSHTAWWRLAALTFYLELREAEEAEGINSDAVLLADMRDRLNAE